VRGGNLLLNVGPDKDGVIPPSHVARLKEIGDWLAKYGDSIYATRPGPLEPADGQYGTTYRDKTVYVHVLDWSPRRASGRREPLAAQSRADQPDTLILPALTQKILAARVLTGNGKAAFTQSDNQVTITLPVDQHDALDTILALDCDSNVEP